MRLYMPWVYIFHMMTNWPENFFEKLPQLKKILNIYSSQDISIYGRVNIVITLAISKLHVTFICSVLDTPKGFIDEVNNNI